MLPYTGQMKFALLNRIFLRSKQIISNAADLLAISFNVLGFFLFNHCSSSSLRAWIYTWRNVKIRKRERKEILFSCADFVREIIFFSSRWKHIFGERTTDRSTCFPTLYIWWYTKALASCIFSRVTVTRDNWAREQIDTGDTPIANPICVSLITP